jgi:hypothetical protein
MENREKEMDFSSPTFNAGLGILIKRDAGRRSVLPLIIRNLFTWETAGLFLLLFGCLLFCGRCFWFCMIPAGHHPYQRNGKC